MKSNVVMIREDERFLQRTKDGYFNANVLLDSWNKDNGTDKQMGSYKSIKATKSLVEELKKEYESPFIASRGKGGTWMCPEMFIDFAMWVSLDFRVKVLKYVVDGLINSRNEAGDYYKEMSATVMSEYIKRNGCKPPATLYMDEAKMIKSIVGVKDRNTATEKQLSIVTSLQKLNAKLIQNGVYKKGREKQLRTLFEALSV